MSADKQDWFEALKPFREKPVSTCSQPEPESVDWKAEAARYKAVAISMQEQRDDWKARYIALRARVLAAMQE